MRPLQSSDYGFRGRGEGEDDGGGSSDRDEQRKESQNKRGKIGRPKNRPVPPPRHNPVSIVPRPSLESQDDRGQSRTPEPRPARRVTHQATDQSHTPTRTTEHPRQHSSNSSRSPEPRRHVRRNRIPRRLSDNIAVDECLTEINFLNRQGDWVKLPNALISPHWRHSFLPTATAEALGHSPSSLEGDDIWTSVTPRGPITYDKAVCSWIELGTMDLPEHLINLPVTNKTGLGVSIILGRDYIEACYGENNWPPREDTQYVTRDASLLMSTYGIDLAASRDHEYYYHDANGEEVATTMETNVNWNMAGPGMNYALTAVGTGIDSYDEVPSGEFGFDYDG